MIEMLHLKDIGKIILTSIFLMCSMLLTAWAGTADEPADGLYQDVKQIWLDDSWEYADFSEIHSGFAVLYVSSSDNRKDYVVGLNAGHGTAGGIEVYTYCHPDRTPKVTGGSTEEGAIKAVAVSGGMVFADGTKEADAVLLIAETVRDKLLKAGYDVLMLRDGEDVQLDNVARTVICNNRADCHISIHFDGDLLDYDKGCFYISVPDELKEKEPVYAVWEASESLGEYLVNGLASQGISVYEPGNIDLDLTQTAYSLVPSVDIELGNQHSSLSQESVEAYTEGLVQGITGYVKEGIKQTRSDPKAF